MYEGYEHPRTIRETDDPALNYQFAYESYEADLAGYLPSGPDLKILDVGCGWGQFLHFLARKGYRDLSAIDIGEQQVAHCRAEGFTAECVEDAAAYLEGSAEMFDLITMHHVIEHMPVEKALHLLRAIHSALKPGGRAIIQTPNMSAVSAMYCRYIEISHCAGYCESNLHQIMGMAGFQSLSVFGNRIPRPTSVRRGIWTMLQRLERAWWRAMLVAELGTDAPRVLSKNLYIIGTKP
ncbi:MAG: class I SAM-dependent methyltransferase [Isosphaeraceae bacterium]|nr:class I SAM-dependent methyltransferase [Isosphaeraceae bacterium]